MNPLVPPTPTLLPAPVVTTVPINVAAWRLWAFADDTVGIWNMINPSHTQTVQILIIVGIIVSAIFIFMSLIKGLADTGDAE